MLLHLAATLESQHAAHQSYSADHPLVIFSCSIMVSESSLIIRQRASAVTAGLGQYRMFPLPLDSEEDGGIVGSTLMAASQALHDRTRVGHNFEGLKG